MWTGAGAALLTFVLVRLQRMYAFVHILPHGHAASMPPAVPLPSASAVLTWLAHAGFSYTVDMIFNFHVGFIGKFNTQKTLVMDGRAIARYYVTKGTFVVDFITACCWLAQVNGTLPTCAKRPNG